MEKRKYGRKERKKEGKKVRRILLEERKNER